MLFYEANGEAFSSPSDIEDWILPIPGRFFEDYPDGRFFRSDITFDFVMFDPEMSVLVQSWGALIGKPTQTVTC